MFGFFRKLFSKPCPATCCSTTVAAPTATVAGNLRAKLLHEDYEFRSIDALHKAAPTMSRETLIATLHDIGARPAYRNSNLWGLKSRVGSRPRRLGY